VKCAATQFDYRLRGPKLEEKGAIGAGRIPPTDRKTEAMTGEKDIVLIYFEDRPLAFARIEGISADFKPGWYHVKLLLLQVPVQVVTWILRDVYIEGAEFTMNGKRMRMEKVTYTDEAAASEPSQESGNALPRDPVAAKVISLAELKKSR
jgi:hypothetical protein